MPRLPESFIEQVQQANDVVDVIGQYVSLKRRGKDYLGLCPFHQEKTPSFTVSPTRQFFKCFGCGVGGSVFQFIMRQTRCEFLDAVRLLADRAGLRMPSTGEPAGAAGLGRADLVKANTFAARFFRDQLLSPAGRGALEYARSRQISDESIRRFGLGWAPEGWDALQTAARTAGLSDAVLVAAGLRGQREDGRSYDRFRNRLMFPILDITGRVIAFGGRALSPEDRAKYLNTAETVLFDKSSNLYGLNWARDAIDRTGQAIVVEGYLDMVIPAQAGVENVVATLGTALTERHVRMLSRFAQDVVLVFDADRAGAAAAERALDLCIAQDVQARVAGIPDGKDPCDFVLAHGGEAFAELVRTAPDALEYAWRQSVERLSGPGASMVQQRQAAEEFLRRVVNSAAYGTIDAVRQGLLVNRLGQLLGLSADQLRRQVRGLMRQVPSAAGARPAMGRGVEAPAPATGLARAQRKVLEVLLVEPDHFEHVARHIGIEDFGDPALAAVAQEIWRLADGGTLSVPALLSARDDDEDWARLVTDLAGQAFTRDQPDRVLGEALALLEEHHRHHEEAELSRQARQQHDQDDALRALQERLGQPSSRRRPPVP